MNQENNSITCSELLSRLASQKSLYDPLKIVAIKKLTKSTQGFDTKVSMAWKSRKVDFCAEVKTRSTPKLIEESLRQLYSDKFKQKQKFLLIVPFLSKAIVEILEREGLSGIDLNGNYLIQSPEVLAIRLDQENRFKETQPIKKIFSGNSSLVGRLLLSSKRRFESVNEVCSAIQVLGGSLSLSAVSKVLKGLEEELIVEKVDKSISLIQPEKLLQRLQEDYRPPKVVGISKLKLPIQELKKIFPPSIQWSLSGESSAERYSVTTPAERVVLYTTNFSSLEKYEDERFYNILLKKTEDSFPFFDMREQKNIRWSSPVQCYLELSKLDKREKELAASIRESILENLK